MESQPNPDRKLIIYGHSFCLQAQLLANELTKQQILYEWRDVLEGPGHFQEELKLLANGNLSVPTIIFPDGTVMVEPWPGQVLEKLGLEPARWNERLIQLGRDK